MATPVDYSAEFTVGPSQLHDVLTDQDYWHDRVNAVGGEGATLSFTPESSEDLIESDWFYVHTTHIIPASDLPPMITKLRPGNLIIHRNEQWGPLVEGNAHGSFSVSVVGVSAKVQGDSALAVTGTTTTVHYRGEVKVSIPFIGAKLESGLSQQVIGLLDNERDFTSSWLAKR